MAFDKEKFLSALKAMKDAFMETQKFVDAKLKDGTIIRYDGDKLDIGVPVMAVTEAGVMAMPDGDHELEDGTKFTIATGVVSAVTPVADPNAEPDKAAAPTAQSQSTSTPMTEAGAKAIVESIIKETRFAEDIAELKAQNAEFKKEKETFSTQKEAKEKEVSDLKTELESTKTTLKELFKLVETIAGEDSATPADKTDKNPPAGKKKTLKELQAEFRGSLKKTN